MNIYQAAVETLLDRPESKEWASLRQALERARGHLPVAWHFPIRACEAVGGNASDARTAVAAITCAHMAIMLIDDILDEDPRGAYHQLGVGRVSNLAIGLNSLGVNVLLASDHLANPALAAQTLNSMMQRTAFGQDLDIMNPQTEEGYWAVARAKSSPYFGAALYIGALCGRAPIEIADQLLQFGHIFGEIMQIHDDLNDCLSVPANVDWLSGRSPLPILFAQIVDHPDRERFIELRGKVEDSEALEEAQSILIHCGAISYSVNELLKRHAQSLELLSRIPLKNAQPIESLLDEAIAPIRHLFTQVGAELRTSI